MISDVHTDLQLPSSGAPSSYIKDRGRETMKHLFSIMIKNAEVPRIKEVENHPACFKGRKEESSEVNYKGT